MARGSLSYSLSLATGGFTAPLRGAMSATKSLVSGLASLGSITMGLASLPQAIGNIMAPLRQPISLAADMEALNTSFRALLKDGGAAKTLVEELISFADVTPFDPVPVAQTGKQLLAFGFAAKSIKPLLTDIGDLAAAMEKPIEDVGAAFGRLNAGDFGEAFLRLRDFGISKTDLEGAGLQFDRSGSFRGSAAKAIEAVRSIIRSKFGGGMADLSQTFKGLFSTFRGYWDALQRAFGKPIMQALKPALQDGTNILQSWIPKAEEWGQKIATAIATIRELFQSGDLWEAARLGLTIAGKELVNILNAGLQGVIAAAISGLAQAAGIFQRLMGESGLWEGIGQKLEAVFLGLKATLLETFADIKESLPAWMGGGPDGPSESDAAEIERLQGKIALYRQQLKDNERYGNRFVADSLTADIAQAESKIKELSGLRGGAELARQGAASASAAGDAALASVDLQGIVTQIGEGLKNTAGAFVAGYQGAGQIMPTGDDTAALNALFAAPLAKAQAFFDQQNGEKTRAAAEETKTNTKGILQHTDGILSGLHLIEGRLQTLATSGGTFA